MSVKLEHSPLLGNDGTKYSNRVTYPVITDFGVEYGSVDSKDDSGKSSQNTPNISVRCSVELSKEDNNNSKNLSGKKYGRSYRCEILCTAICSLGNLAHGFAYGLASPAVPQLVEDGILTLEQASWFESLLTLGALFAGIFVGVGIGLFGRRGTLLLSSIPFTAGWLCIGLTEWYVVLYVGRILTGIGYGLVAVVGPIYIAEIASREIRGALSMGVVLGSTSGTLIQFCLGLVLNTRSLAFVSMIPVIMMAIGMIFMPESPRWLLMKNRGDKAMKALVWLRKSTTIDVQLEYNEIASYVEAMNKAGQPRATSVIHQLPSAVKPIFICIMLLVFQQFSGITPVMFNTQEIFHLVGFTSKLEFLNTGEMPAILIAAVKMFATFLGIFLIDRVGRRPLFITCGFIMGCSCITVGLYFYYKAFLHTDYTAVPFVTLILYVGCYSIAWAGIPWLVVSEVPPLQVRGIASAASSIGTRLSSFIITQQYGTLISEIGMSGTFFIFGGVCFAGSIFACWLIPEKRNLPLETLEEELTLSVHVRTIEN